MNPRKLIHWSFLFLGDAAALALVTIAGFYRHGEINSGSGRMLATFIPLVVGWALINPWLGASNLALAGRWQQLWRPLLAMLLAAPFAAWLRGLWLSEAIPVIFVPVIGAFSALGILIWRSIWYLLNRKGEKVAPVSASETVSSQGDTTHG